jgi:TonB family protein
LLMNKELSLGILISLFFHFLIVVLLPGLPRPELKKPDYIEVDVFQWKGVVSAKEAKKDVIQEVKEEPKTKVKQIAVKKAKEEPKVELKQVALEKVKKMTVEKVKTDVGEKVAEKPVKRSFTYLQPFYKKAEVFGTQRVVKNLVETELPALKETNAQKIEIEKKFVLPKQQIVEELSGKAEDMDKGTPLIEDSVKLEKKAPAEMFSMKEMDKKELIEKEIAEQIKGKDSESVFHIRGPVSKRRQVVYKPSLPKTARAEGEIELKFWVLPDGTVGRIVPLKRGDPFLEEEAIRYLKKWKFNPLDKTQGEEWGIIPIRFVLK